MRERERYELALIRQKKYKDLGGNKNTSKEYRRYPKLHKLS